MTDLFDNPVGTRGFAFVEYTSETPADLSMLFDKLGFTNVGVRKGGDVARFVQGDIVFLLNFVADGQPKAFRDQHGPGANAMGFLVDDADAAMKTALQRGATEATSRTGSMPDHVPAIEGIGGLVVYLLDAAMMEEVFSSDYADNGADPVARSKGLTYIDHLTHNLHRGNMDKWASYYEDIFNFREIRYFDIEGKVTGLVSKAMTSPDGNIRIPLNESQDDKSQIEEFLGKYGGEGIQHIALGCSGVYETVETLRASAVPFQDTPDTYYDQLPDRIPNHGEDADRLRRNKILIDGAPTDDQGLLLQIFTQDNIGLGPIFFEIIERKGNEGFGEGNFKALFESIELDQIRRGVIAAE